jgi:hypothetical protein
MSEEHEALLPRLVSLARHQRTLYALHSGNVQRFRMGGCPAEEVAEAEQEAQRAKTYYENLVALKRLVESAHLSLDNALSAAQWNQEMEALLGAMPSAARQDLGLVGAAAVTQ